jgi:two-component system chemotaxis response regulator CheB
VVIGCSAGGLRALHSVLSSLHATLSVPVIVVFHNGIEETEMLCDLLRRKSALPVEEAREREVPRPGCVYIAPSGYHLLVEASQRFALSVDAKVCHVRPAIDVLFESAARVWRTGLLAVIMTGANADGAAGLRVVRHCGGTAIVQDPADAESPVMPESALQQAGADHCVPLHEIAPLINRLVGA